MKMLDKERRRKKNRVTTFGQESSASDVHGKSNNGFNHKTNACDVVQATSYDDATSDKGNGNDDLAYQKRSQSSQISNSSIHTEIRTDDFVVRLLFINFCLNYQIKNQTQKLHTQKQNMNRQIKSDAITYKAKMTILL